MVHAGKCKVVSRERTRIKECPVFFFLLGMDVPGMDDGCGATGVLRVGFHGGDLDAAVHRAHLVQVQLQQVDLSQFVLRNHRHRFHRAMVSVVDTLPVGRIRNQPPPSTPLREDRFSKLG